MSNCKFLMYVFIISLLLGSDLFSDQTVLLRNGDSVQGNITNQDIDSLSIQKTDGQIVIVPKEKLLKVIYRQVDEAEKERIRKEEEEKLAEKERLEESAKLKKQEEKRRILEEKRKEFEEERISQLNSMEEELGKKKAKSESSKKLSGSDEGYMTQYRFSQIFSNANVKLAPPSANCKGFSRSSDWYWLFGTFHITRPNMEKLLPKADASIRIRAENNWVDVGTSTVLGILGTVTRRTIIVETCGSGNMGKFYTEDELKYELEKQKFQLESKFMKEKEEILLLKDGVE